MVIEKKRRINKLWIIVAALIFLHFYKLPYYFSQPGDAKEISPYVEVEGGYKEEQGSFMLTTVLMGQTNLYFYAWAHFSEYRELIPENQVRRPEETDEDYNHRQIMLMNSSQEAAKIVAYQKAGKTVDFIYNGIMVTSFIDGMPAEKHLTYDDRILKVDGFPVQSVTELNHRLAGKEAGEETILTITRNGEEIEVAIPLAPFPESVDGGEGRVGIGIMYPVVDREVNLEPSVTIDVQNIGGPSAGLMFSLEVYNQLTPEDITKGYQISGTGTIDEEGNVGRIGGVKQKVVAAHKAGADFFFVPNDSDHENSNYLDALATAESLDTNTEIVPVQTFDEAVAFLTELEKK